MMYTYKKNSARARAFVRSWTKVPQCECHNASERVREKNSFMYLLNGTDQPTGRIALSFAEKSGKNGSDRYIYMPGHR